MDIECMRISDKYALDWLRVRVADDSGPITYIAMAESIGCHPNTAANILRRLRAAGVLTIAGGCRRTGYVYVIGGGDE